MKYAKQHGRKCREHEDWCLRELETQLSLVCSYVIQGEGERISEKVTGPMDRACLPLHYRILGILSQYLTATSHSISMHFTSPDFLPVNKNNHKAAMSTASAYNLRREILSVQAAITTALQSYHSSIQIISTLGWTALSTPTMTEAQRRNPLLAIPFNLYKRCWVCYLHHCKKCIDTMWMAVLQKEHIAAMIDRLERGSVGEAEKERCERLLIAKTNMMFEEEVGVLIWEMKTLKSCFERIRVEKARIEAMAGEMLVVDM